MSLFTKIKGKNEVITEVNNEGFLYSIDSSYPATVKEKFTIPYREYFRNSSGSNSFLLDGSVNNIEFTIESIKDYDIYISTVNILISDIGANLKKFGNILELTNGLEFKWSSKDFGDVIIHDAIKTNLDIMRLSGGSPAIGTGTRVFKVDLTGTGQDAFMSQIDFKNMFGVKWGILLRSNSTDKLVLTIRDNIKGIDNMDVISYGIKIKK